MNENLGFEQDYYSRTATGNFKLGHDSVRLMRRLVYYDRSYYENKNYYDQIGSVLKCVKEIS